MNTTTQAKRLFAAGRMTPGIAPVIVTEDDVLERWHEVIQNEIDATPVDADVPDYYQLGQNDSAAGIYLPPSWSKTTEYDNYIRGWNDAWAARENRTLTR